jgi:hypothetical protein
MVVNPQLVSAKEAIIKVGDGRGCGQQILAAWLLTLDDEWEKCEVEIDWRLVTFVNAKKGIAPGTSGSPILTEDGGAVGIISSGTIEPRLVSVLPAWRLEKGGE